MRKPHTFTEEAKDWSYGDHNQSLAEFIAELQEIYSQLSDEGKATAVFSYESNSSDWGSSHMKIIYNRTETPEEVAEDERETNERELAERRAREKDKEVRDRREWARLKEKFGTEGPSS